MEITRESEIWILVQLVLEHKFGAGLCSSELAGSEPLSKAVDTIWSAFQNTKFYTITAPRNGWDAWRCLSPDRIEWERVVSWLKDAKCWDEWSSEMKLTYINMLASPFKIADDHISNLLNSR